MIQLIVVCEGPAEETFVRDVLMEPFASRGIFIGPRLIPTSGSSKGGAIVWDRVLRFLRNTLRERRDTYVTTFFDLYRLPHEYPGMQEAARLRDLLDRAHAIEACLGEAVVREAGCRANRFFAHIQPHEFEALLFSDTDAVVSLEQNWMSAAEPLRTARRSAPSPEHIDDGESTHPSARLKAQLHGPPFEKVLHGIRAAGRIGLTKIREECRHFHRWLEHIERLQPL